MIKKGKIIGNVSRMWSNAWKIHWGRCAVYTQKCTVAIKIFTHVQIIHPAIHKLSKKFCVCYLWLLSNGNPKYIIAHKLSLAVIIFKKRWKITAVFRFFYFFISQKAKFIFANNFQKKSLQIKILCIHFLNKLFFDWFQEPGCCS